MNITPITISYEHLQEFLYQVSKINYSERTQARWISSIKGFFGFLLEDELREDNPSALLETPKLGLYLPDTLSLEEIEKTNFCNGRKYRFSKEKPLYDRGFVWLRAARFGTYGASDFKYQF